MASKALRVLLCVYDMIIHVNTYNATASIWVVCMESRTWVHSFCYLLCRWYTVFVHCWFFIAFYSKVILCLFLKHNIEEGTINLLRCSVFKLLILVLFNGTNSFYLKLRINRINECFVENLDENEIQKVRPICSNWTDPIFFQGT